MPIPEFTLVCGTDVKHLTQMSLTLPTWWKHKPSLFSRPMILFFDGGNSRISDDELHEFIKHPNLTIVRWPPEGITFEGDGSCKWNRPQRYRMLAGFVHIPAKYVKTPYWLKLDTDAIALGQDDWIDPNWFNDKPAFIGSTWSYTKPADQMVKLDEWVASNSNILKEWSSKSPLNLIPKPDAGTLRGKRAVSWCAFFETDFTRRCSIAAEFTCGECKLPVPSQDGYMWYMAMRGKCGVLYVKMKSRGWSIRTSMKGITQKVSESLGIEYE